MFVPIALLTFVASFIGTIAGFGSSTIMLPVVILMFPLPEALLLVGIVHFFNDIWEVILFRGKPHWRTLIIFGGTGVVAGLLGADLAITVSQDILSRALGALLIALVVIFTVDKKLKIPHTDGMFAVGGSLSGFLAGIFGIGGPVRSLFLSGFKLTKKEYIFTIGAVSFLVDAARISAYMIGGARLPEGLFLGTILLIPISLFAAEIAKVVVDKIPQKAFQFILSLFLLIAGTKFLLFP